jgi:hypothetical protein
MFMRHNVIYLVLLIISAAIFTVFIYPVLQMHHMSWLAYVFYGLVIVAFLYGRTTMVRGRPRPPS